MACTVARGMTDYPMGSSWLFCICCDETIVDWKLDDEVVEAAKPFGVTMSTWFNKLEVMRASPSAI